METEPSPVQQVVECPGVDVRPEGRLRRVGRLVRRLGPAGPMAIVAAVMPLLGAVVLLGFVGRIAPVVRAHAWGPVACAAAFAILGGFALLYTTALALFAGWAFGFWVGYATALGGFVGAALVGYFIALRAGGSRVLEVLDEHPRCRAVHRALLHSGPVRTFWIVFLLRLPSAPPFAATTVVLASVRTRLGPYLLGTVLGLAPRTAVYVYLASKAETLNLKQGENVWLLALSAVGAVAAIAVITFVARRALTNLTAGERTAA